MVRNEQLIFATTPNEYPIPGETLRKETSDFDATQSAPSGGLVTKTVCLSLDPYLRGRLRDGGDSYVPAFEKGKPIENFGISEVLSSSAEGIKEGDRVYGSTRFAEYNIFTADQVKGLKVIKNDEKLPWTTWVGAAGMPGQTAWWALKHIGQPKKGETIFVSGASGAVGQLVIALAHSAGLKVIASAGSDEKVDFLKSHLNVEVAFNYKTKPTLEILKKNPFQIYWDNIGGETLENVLATIESKGRIIACGAASQYNTRTPYGIKNSFQITAKSLKVQGFIILTEDITGFYDEVPKLIAEGKVPEPKEHHVKGLDQGEAFTALLKGDSTGKVVYIFE
ncbi:hypothetical protein MVLG_02091 [Microbotryum lychnidis-dioicae p1A1 Lamole]|uniref:Enoyl reductase (ER) domain-containing protein n=1 Tax=Microbotryum lychnidis-dioicae (strain p1A1 Lamole / MvSl-1064) TaxID=683840 RepID=U5H443_USTV1|nr:hypothetical protein MVLG_02091 [Microbotryum lychnidis-dioicae p1A1 Lamole]|eukprot:KDE07628.1 hypothetical protein MVLG_02091 [Microbotryum lychnidis-dioicae p1A1 Lamole]